MQYETFGTLLISVSFSKNVKVGSVFCTASQQLARGDMKYIFTNVCNVLSYHEMFSAWQLLYERVSAPACARI